jgi:hypothetical protein
MADGQLLPSWNDGATKSAILDFVARVTKQGSAEFVPPAGRIATFDNDGTLWCEQPLQIQFFFAFDRVKQLSAKDPTMSERQPFKAVLEHDYDTLFGSVNTRCSNWLSRPMRATRRVSFLGLGCSANQARITGPCAKESALRRVASTQADGCAALPSAAYPNYLEARARSARLCGTERVQVFGVGSGECGKFRTIVKKSQKKQGPENRGCGIFRTAAVRRAGGQP